MVENQRQAPKGPEVSGLGSQKDNLDSLLGMLLGHLNNIFFLPLAVSPSVPTSGGLCNLLVCLLVMYQTLLHLAVFVRDGRTPTSADGLCNIHQMIARAKRWLGRGSC